MAVALKTYDPGRVAVDFLGSLLDGFAPGTFISITTPELFTSEAGVDAVARLRMRDRRAQIEISFLQTSPANLIMSGIVTLDKGGNGVGPLIIKDNSGNTLFTALTCWIKKEPDVSFSADSVETYTWQLECDSYDLVVGGN